MADELTTGAVLRRTVSIPKFSVGEASRTADMTGTLINDMVQTIGATQEVLVVNADIASLGWAYFDNQSATESVEIGIVVSETFYPILDLGPLEQSGPMKLYATVSLYARGSSTGVNLRHFIAEL